MKLRPAIAVCAFAACAAGPVSAQPALMSAEWAQGACEAWNKDAVLTDQLVETGWVKNEFENFLLLVGKVPGNAQGCPAG
jgi:hypothetical protein